MFGILVLLPDGDNTVVPGTLTGFSDPKRPEHGGIYPRDLIQVQTSDGQNLMVEAKDIRNTEGEPISLDDLLKAIHAVNAIWVDEMLRRNGD